MIVCPYKNIGTGKCLDCQIEHGYHGCARYKYASVRGIGNTPEYVGVMDQGRLLELNKFE
jgi:hypothetical protein